MELTNNFSSFNHTLIPSVQPKSIYSHQISKNSIKLIKYVKLLIFYIIIILICIIVFFIKSVCLRSSISLYEKQKEELNQEIESFKQSYDHLVSENGGISSDLFNIITNKMKLINKYTQLESEYNIEQIKRLFKIKVSLNQIYKATYDGTTPKVFHEKCDTVSPSVVLIITKRGNCFGGFTYRTWDGHDVYKEDPDAFLFNLNKMEIYGINPKKKSEAIYVIENSFPHFGKRDILISSNFSSPYHSSSFPNSYGNSIDLKEYYQLTNLEIYYELKEILVYQVTFLH